MSTLYNNNNNRPNNRHNNRASVNKLKTSKPASTKKINIKEEFFWFIPAPWRVRPHELILNFLCRVRQPPSMD